MEAKAEMEENAKLKAEVDQPKNSAPKMEECPFCPSVKSHKTRIKEVWDYAKNNRPKTDADLEKRIFVKPKLQKVIHLSVLMAWSRSTKVIIPCVKKNFYSFQGNNITMTKVF